MITNKKLTLLALLFTLFAFSACKKAEYSIGDIVEIGETRLNSSHG